MFFQIQPQLTQQPLRTKPAKGEKINPNSALVKKYEMFLEKEHSKALAAVGVSQSAKTHDYTIALNGFAAQLTEVQAAQIAKQPGVAMVLKDVRALQDHRQQPHVPRPEQ